MDEKEYLEVTAANTFCKAYSGMYQVQAAFDHLNMPRKPDVTVCIDGAPQDLEIAHLYSNEEEAKQLKTLFHQPLMFCYPPEVQCLCHHSRLIC